MVFPSEYLQMVMVTTAITSMIAGTLVVAITQQNIERLLAYSSICTLDIYWLHLYW